LGRYWAISRTITGDQALAAAAFLEFITQPERQLTWATRFNLLPTRREALDSPTIVNDPVWRVNAAQMRAGRTLLLGTNANFLLDAMREPLRAALAGELTPAEAVERMQANTEE
jgi:ABC-type glycerol-3-phosphate transport system substrate-binding protein